MHFDVINIADHGRVTPLCALEMCKCTKRKLKVLCIQKKLN